MSARRMRYLCLIVASLCGLAAGCTTTHETVQTDGSFVTGGSGQYGQPASGADMVSSVKPGGGSGFFSRSKVKPTTHLAYAQWQEKLGNEAAARQSYEQVLAADGKSVDAIIGMARLDQIAGRIADAEQGFQKAVRLDTKTGRALDALGQFYAEQGRWNEAVPMLHRAMDLARNDKTVRFHYAIALAKSGQVESAMPHLVEAVGSAAAHYNMGVILHDTGNLTGAEEQFVAAVLENPRLEQAQEWLDQVRRERDRAGHAGGGARGDDIRNGDGPQAVTRHVTSNTAPVQSVPTR